MGIFGVPVTNWNRGSEVMAEIREGRRVGNSTRQANEYIEKLFAEKKIFVSDHAGKQNLGYRGADKDLFKLILRRMYQEHPTIRYVADMSRLTIEIQDK